MSLGAELTTDYEERTSVTSYRVMFSGFIPAFIIIFGLLFFFTPKPGTENGMMNADAYPAFARLCVGLIILSILISTYGTKNTIPHLPQSHGESERANLREISYAHVIQNENECFKFNAPDSLSSCCLDCARSSPVLLFDPTQIRRNRYWCKMDSHSAFRYCHH
ncbi:MAG: MFS transporter [Saprospiraceae bacterium]|nr:MFS transporter [Saprospiraceae bacterium]